MMVLMSRLFPLQNNIFFEKIILKKGGRESISLSSFFFVFSSLFFLFNCVVVLFDNPVSEPNYCFSGQFVKKCITYIIYYL